VERRSQAVTTIRSARDEQSVVKSAARVLHIFELFGDIQRAARAGEIAERLGYPQSSTSVLLKSLAQLGYLEFDAAGRTYLPSPRVALLGAWLASPGSSIAPVMQIMQDLSQETGMTITLSARNGIYAQYIHVIQATSTLRLHTPTGTNRMLVWSAAGFALISDMEDASIRSLVHRTRNEFAVSRRKVNVAAVLEHVNTFRRQGYFLSRELVTPGGGHISMRLPDDENRTRPLAIGISGWVEDVQRDEARFVRSMRRVIDAYFPAAGRARGRWKRSA
jgi:DNA-binding IclR family transcriptional regulator